MYKFAMLEQKNIVIISTIKITNLSNNFNQSAITQVWYTGVVLASM